MNRYQNISLTKIDGKQLLKTVRYPEIPLSENDLYIVTNQGDRFDTLAYKFYNDETLWWIISIANDNVKQNSLVTPEGIQLRIPTNIAEIIQKYNSINS